MDARELTVRCHKLEDELFLMKKKQEELINVVNTLLMHVGDLENQNLSTMRIED